MSANRLTRPSIRRVFPCCALICGTLAACGDSAGPHGKSIIVISGAAVSDTIFATLVAPLVVEVRNERGALASGIVVRFQGVPPPAVPPSTSWVARSMVYIRPVADAPIQEFAFDTTDAKGRASVFVTFGPFAGEGTVALSAPALAAEARATFTIRPGAAISVVLLPADSAVYVGNGYSLRGAVVDRAGNARAEEVTYSGPGTHTRLAAAGTISGESIGRDFVVAAHGSWRDTSWVSVVPRGRLAAVQVRRTNSDTTTVILFELDGTIYKRTPAPHSVEPRPDLAPDGRGLVMEESIPDAYDNNHLVVDDDGGRRRLVSPSAGLRQEFFPQYSADGQWIYFSGMPPNLYRQLETWRIHPDGSGAERVGTPAGYFEGDSYPSPSPDGRRVAYATNRFPCCYFHTLRVLDLTTGAIDSLVAPDGTPVPGTMPRWAPVGETIGYTSENSHTTLGDQIWLMNPDGTNRRMISRADRAYRSGFDWSPDGKWIVSYSFTDSRLHLIEVATGLTLPLGYTASISQPAWQP